MTDKPRIKFAHECRPCVMCGDPWCDDCQDHYADCACLGPNSTPYLVEDQSPQDQGESH